MCLIIVTTGRKLQDTLLNTKGLLADIYGSNPDGIGAMYTTSKRRLRTPKVLPRNVVDVRNFIRMLPGDDRQIAVHFRYRTHGDKDLENCHPYIVLPGRVAMMHNGVLSHGNAADKSKSDTWHYIDSYLRPLLEAYPKAFTNIGVQGIIENDISTGNRFVLLDQEGEMVVLNRDTGIEYDDIWFSNTYAWSPELLIPDYNPPKKTVTSPYWGGYDYGYRGWGSAALPKLTYGTGQAVEDDDYDVDPDEDVTFASDVWAALSDTDSLYLADLLRDYPRSTLLTVMRDNDFILDVSDADSLTANDAWLAKKLVDRDIDALAARIRATPASAEQLADVMLWYGVWADRVHEDEDVGYEAAAQQLVQTTALAK